MARIVEPAQPKRVKCNECAATIEYLPEDVETYHYNCMGDSGGETFIRCPRETAKGTLCKGRGVLKSW